MKRERMLKTIHEQGDTPWDIIVIGGGATGLGTALDAASRGYRTLLLEQSDFTKGTSSRSTKLVHGGVRYLAQGDISLVLEALHERGLMRRNAPHLVKNQSFIIPNYDWWDGPFYTVGMKVYDMMAGKLGLGPSQSLSREEVLRAIPNLKTEGLRGGVIYYDGQFDDSRLAINIAQTCAEHGGVVVNYMRVTGLLKNDDGLVCGVEAVDQENGDTYRLQGRSVVNATGVFVDEIMHMDDPGAPRLVRPSQGVHIILDKEFLRGDSAIMIPKTSDGRVLFAVPWHERVVVGTTDTPLEECSLEPRALEEEVDFILSTAKKYLTREPQRCDILSIFAGLRPLAAPREGSDATATKEISRNHHLRVSISGLVTITGGKWTTYRKMAQDTVDKAAMVGGLESRKCLTENMPIHGWLSNVDYHDPLYYYGSDADYMRDIVSEHPELGRKLHARLPYTAIEVTWSARYEMARTVEDILARRQRALFLDARAAIDMAPEVARILAMELERDANWQKEQVETFTDLARGYYLED
ncbi:glycerol-3-phosphate dehydrogenase [Desulfolithobacter dissulfuricans]|uniref:Glycerol-3-phosphate dehydrogenase n=1 Tax=Desulfolithobacter dissulfuricans TaxID=2795293 RepID=A0A915TYH3_9BACT|nr:glycerol-3-phosphate dehydrogenase/oxidase [Desulfolithobacter dissulfuricans]BCO08114.1 glycerol-3-phosphate dehydrogenase [Desulfolithobacter dissulfuricans]